MKDRNKDRREPSQDPDVQDESLEYPDEKSKHGCFPEPDDEFDDEDWDDAWDDDEYIDRHDKDSSLRRHRTKRRDVDSDLS